MRAPLAPLAVLLALTAGCATASAPRGLLRVDLPDPGPGSPGELQLVRAVRDAADAEGLLCQPQSGAALLRCTAATVGNSSRAVTIGLERSGTGYEVSIEKAFNLFSGPASVCEVQRYVSDRIDAELQFPIARVDVRSDCKER